MRNREKIRIGALIGAIEELLEDTAIALADLEYLVTIAGEEE
jgi:hypothetical protein